MSTENQQLVVVAIALVLASAVAYLSYIGWI